MNKIKCDEHSCNHNCSSMCHKQTVKISNKAKCDSFDKNYKSVFEKEETFLEEYATMDDDLINESNMILCDSFSCQSNKDGLCAKNKIIVAKDGTQPRCIDYISKGE